MYIAGVYLASEGRESLTLIQRSRFDIMASVLSTAVSGRTKTYIMRKCHLSYRQLQAYLDFLVDKDLLNVDLHEVNEKPAKIFVTTDKGRAFLSDYNDLKTTMEKSNRISPKKVRT